MTRYAELICNIINDSHEHMTADQVFLELKKTEPTVVLATIYNNLNMLCSQGLIRRISMEGSPDRYDKVQKHDHLVCKGCGKLSDMTFKDFTHDLEQQLRHGILAYDLKVYYLCPACKNK